MYPVVNFSQFLTTMKSLTLVRIQCKTITDTSCMRTAEKEKVRKRNAVGTRPYNNHRKDVYFILCRENLQKIQLQCYLS